MAQAATQIAATQEEQRRYLDEWMSRFEAAVADMCSAAATKGG
jgi:hypothetical protein